MFRFIVIFVLVAIVSGCYPEQAFRPPPSEFKGWIKSGTTESDVKAQMLSCGFSNPYYADRRDTINDEAQQESCMFDNGYTYKSGYKGICYGQNWEEKPACVEYRKTHP